MSADPEEKIENSNTAVLNNNITVEFGKQDSGYAWVIAAASFFIQFGGWGVTNSFGIFLDYYLQDPILNEYSRSQLAWIGSTATGALFLTAWPAGVLIQYFGHKALAISGSVLFIIAAMLAGTADNLMQLVLLQGVGMGAGFSMAFVSAIAILGPWFNKKLGIATGIAISAGGIGGLTWSIIIDNLLVSFGRKTTFLVVASCAGTMMLISSLMLKPRINEIVTPLSYRALLKNKIFYLMFLFQILTNAGFFAPFFFIPNYASSYNLGNGTGATLIAILNIASAIGCIGWGKISDIIGPINVITASTLVSSLSIYLIWPLATNFAGLVLFVVLYGIGIGGYIGVFPSVVGSLFGNDSLSAIIGVLYAAETIGALGGPPAAAYIIDLNSEEKDGVLFTNYTPMIMAAASTMFGGFLLVFYVRQIQT